jgi:hypothetical protein
VPKNSSRTKSTPIAGKTLVIEGYILALKIFHKFSTFIFRACRCPTANPIENQLLTAYLTNTQLHFNTAVMATNGVKHTYALTESHKDVSFQCPST